ncbi:phage minor head protein [Thiohalomonas denitrificans]|uniref:phage minor head protein n=1 Tax=Thiohalomonas denitrificans TaxID=415747 RepID=UPI0026F35E5D|nr:phage minor head protein [Thiohalomonas denitrificans]
MPKAESDYEFPGPVPREATAWFRRKGYKVGFDHRDVWGEEHAAAFTVAKAMEMDVLTGIRGEVDRALAEGRTFQQFQRDLRPTLERLGWWGTGEMTDPLTGDSREVQLGSPRRLQTIYRTNLRTARAAGQWDRIQRTTKTHPYLIYELGPSEEHRKQHVDWSRRILPTDDPWWTTHYPPNGWGCKCRVRQVSRREAERLGGPHQAPADESVEWVNKRTGEVMQVPKGIDPGWDYNPGAHRQMGVDGNLAVSRAAFDKTVPKPVKTGRLWPEDTDPVFSTVSGVNQQAMEHLLHQIPGASSQVQTFQRFLEAHPVKSLFLKQAEMAQGKTSRKIENKVGEFLGDSWKGFPRVAYTIRRASRVGGFTARSFDHVVVRVRATDKLADVVPSDLKKAVEKAVAADAPRGAGSRDGRYWTTRAALDRLTDQARPGVPATFAHEMGHQVHYWAGEPRRPDGSASLTVYGMTDDREWHAEHFTAWLFNRKALAKWSPDTAEYFDKLLDTAIDRKQKGR